MLGKVDIFTRELRKRWHLLLIARVVQPINGNQQDIFPRPHIAVAQIA